MPQCQADGHNTCEGPKDDSDCVFLLALIQKASIALYISP